MSKIQKNAQPKKPLGGGEKAGASEDNRVLYAILIILTAFFVWKMLSHEEKIHSIDIDKTTPDEIIQDITATESESDLSPTAALEPSPNVEVEIREVESTGEVLASQEETFSAVNSNPISNDVATYSTSSNDNVISSNDTYTSADVSDDFIYIYTSSVEMPSGSFAGRDNQGFARSTNVDVAVEVSRFDGSTGGLVNIPEEDFNSTSSTARDYSLALGTPVASDVSYPTYSSNENSASNTTYPNTGITYGTETYPLQDTLPWHPYESLAYLKEEEEVFVAEKVRKFPRAEDLIPDVPANTLGDRDTRMGFGVVIRPNK